MKFSLVNVNAIVSLACALASLTLHAADPVGKNNQASAPEDFLRANMDPSVNPGDDFFEYANAGWLRRNPIPASESAWGIGKVVREELYTNLRKINEQAVASVSPAGSEQRKIGDFWLTAIDMAKADQLGVRPLQAELERIN